MKFYKKKTIERDGQPYLIRYSLFSCFLFAIKVHKILRSDHDCLHDHPWTFITFLLKGGYVEYSHAKEPVWDGREYITPIKSKVYSRFSLLYRPAHYTHRLEIHQPVWSIVITFKKVREWGFVTKYGWLPWRLYDSQNHCDV